jgi:hypothetical protein
VETEVPRDVVARHRARIEPREEIDARQRRDEEIVGIQLVAASIERRRIGARRRGQIDRGPPAGFGQRRRPIPN